MPILSLPAHGYIHVEGGPMYRLLPLVLFACQPSISDYVEPTAPDVLPEPQVNASCDDAFEVDHTWSVPIPDYGMVRGADAFMEDRATFAHSSGVYDNVLRTFSVQDGTILSEEMDRERHLMLRHTESDTDVVIVEGDLHLVQTSTGKVRGTVSGNDLGWMGPSLTLDGATLAMVRCNDSDLAEIVSYELDGRLRRATTSPTPCHQAYSPTMDIDDAAGSVVMVSGDRGQLLDLATGSTTPLTRHAESDSQVVSTVHDVAFSPDGAVVATAGIDGRLLLHSADSGSLVAERAVRVTPVNRNIYAGPDTRSPFAWSPDSRLLARGLDDDTIVIERVCDGAIVQILQTDLTLTPATAQDGAAPATLHFAPDSRALIAVYEGGVQGFVVDDGR